MIQKLNIKGDRGIWTIMVILALISLLVVYSSIVTLADKHHGGSTLYYLIKHGLFLTIGMGITYGVSKLNFKYFSKFSLLAIFTAIPLLAYTLFAGASLNEANRWIVIPIINQTFQTSDFAKLALIMYVARSLTVQQLDNKNAKAIILYIILPILAVCGLILPANLSTASVLLVSSFSLLFIGRVPLTLLGGIITSITMALLLFFFIGKTYPDLMPKRFGTWVNRIENFSKPDSEKAEDLKGNYQAQNAKIAIARGGIKGQGPGKSVQRNVLPHPYSDFIYAIVIEEYGLIGGFGVMLLYLLLLYRCIKVVKKTSSVFGKLLVCGITFILVFQALINMAVATGLMPVTGQPLPLISMGGTSIWFTCLSIGIILSVSAASEKNANPSKLKTYG